jgi:hypothetical protein
MKTLVISLKNRSDDNLSYDLKRQKNKYPHAQKQRMAAHPTAIPALPYTAFLAPRLLRG